MKDLDLTTLRLFVAACDLGNIARAGEQQHIGSSAISKRMALLEEQVQARCWSATAGAWCPPQPG